MDHLKSRPNQLREDRKGIVDTGTVRGCKARHEPRPPSTRPFTTNSTAGLKPASYWT